MQLSAKKISSIVFSIFLGLSSIAQIPSYYNSINFNLNGEELREQLTNLVTQTHNTPITYTPGVWNVLKSCDLDPNDASVVLLIYGYDDNDGVFSTDRTRDKDESCHTAGCIGKWEREHVFAQSLANPTMFTNEPGTGTDAHNLRAIDSQRNGTRSNRPFEESTGNSRILPSGNWYPGDEWIGDVARMMMYMYLRYRDQCEATTIGVGPANYSDFGDMPDVFLEWNKRDPVSDIEVIRNNTIQAHQGNRNPFIDNPNIATKIWKGPPAADLWGVLSTENETWTTTSVFPTVTSSTINIKSSQNIEFNYVLKDATGKIVKESKTNSLIDVSDFQKGFYFLTLEEKGNSKSFKIIVN
jgi:endonuclease I